MTRPIGLCCAVVLVLVTSASADDKADEWKPLKGIWKVEKATLMGNDATAAFGSVVLTMDDGKYTVVFGGQEDKGTITLDAAKKPKQMVIKTTEGANKDKTFRAIYELEGDSLKVCYDLD